MGLLLAVRSVLAERGGRSAQDTALVRGVNRHLHALTTAATTPQAGAT
ncbi:hypothetical protein [Streptomyces acidicola]